ncbi:hypothetical protein HW555_013224 [Spodoptera exigua]|uniref:Uncharacterized protein n=1 Tax=Spodoptera exigua TaxID=7107 RepID=A0A835G1Z2_SPOEX|nr:hypothetical protein HW555_013224 [Spodoptera exigua]
MQVIQYYKDGGGLRIPLINLKRNSKMQKNLQNETTTSINESENEQDNQEGTSKTRYQRQPPKRKMCPRRWQTTLTELHQPHGYYYPNSNYQGGYQTQHFATSQQTPLIRPQSSNIPDQMDSPSNVFPNSSILSILSTEEDFDFSCSLNAVDSTAMKLHANCPSTCSFIATELRHYRVRVLERNHTTTAPRHHTHSFLPRSPVPAPRVPAHLMFVRSVTERSLESAYLQKKWKLLRDNFTRYEKKINMMKSGSASFNLRPCTYHQQLLFLKDLQDRGERSSNLDSTPEEPPSSQNSEDELIEKLTKRVNKKINDDEEERDDFKRIPDHFKLEAKADFINTIKKYTAQYNVPGPPYQSINDFRGYFTSNVNYNTASTSNVPPIQQETFSRPATTESQYSNIASLDNYSDDGSTSALYMTLFTLIGNRLTDFVSAPTRNVGCFASPLRPEKNRVGSRSPMIKNGAVHICLMSEPITLSPLPLIPFVRTSYLRSRTHTSRRASRVVVFLLYARLSYKPIKHDQITFALLTHSQDSQQDNATATSSRKRRCGSDGDSDIAEALQVLKNMSASSFARDDASAEMGVYSRPSTVAAAQGYFTTSTSESVRPSTIHSSIQDTDNSDTQDSLFTYLENN